MTNWRNLPIHKEGGESPRPLISKYSIPDYTQFQCPLSDIEYGPDKAAKQNPHLVTDIHAKIDLEGLRWPVILKEGTHKKYKCYIGNNRIAYAVERGYNSITAIVVTNPVDKLHIMQYCKRIDEHGFDSK